MKTRTIILLGVGLLLLGVAAVLCLFYLEVQPRTSPRHSYAPIGANAQGKQVVISFTNTFVRSSVIYPAIYVSNGVPASLAVLVDRMDFSNVRIAVRGVVAIGLRIGNNIDR